MIVSLKKLADIRSQHNNDKIVLTSGTFDLFHLGHVNYLKAAKAYGDILVVLLSGDNRVKLRKGSNRPIIPEADRALILDALKTVDYVFIDPSREDPSSSTPFYAEVIAMLQPDLYVTDGEDPRFTDILDKTQRIVLPRIDGGEYDSTSAIIKHIANLH